MFTPIFILSLYFHLLLLYIIFFLYIFSFTLYIFMCVYVFAWVYYFWMEWSLINFYHANMFYLLSILHVYVVWFRKFNLLWLLLETIIVGFFLWYCISLLAVTERKRTPIYFDFILTNRYTLIVFGQKKIYTLIIHMLL